MQGIGGSLAFARCVKCSGFGGCSRQLQNFQLLQIAGRELGARGRRSGGGVCDREQQKGRNEHRKAE
jgi:hypothetical protein